MTTISHTTHSHAAPISIPAQDARNALSLALAHHGISVILPAFNEETAIAATLADVLATLDEWGADFEIIVVNDGSRDRTGEIVANIAAQDARVRQVLHPANLGYGATLADGFSSASKDLTFFMDADGQFTTQDLAKLLVAIDSADAVLGYRLHRHDSWLRRCNAWAWNRLVAVMLGLRVRDVDCAYKLLRTTFLQAHLPETQSALVNAEILFKLTRTGALYRQVGVRHLPRQGGRATGAHPRVIYRAVRDLLRYAPRWRRATAGHV